MSRMRRAVRRGIVGLGARYRGGMSRNVPHVHEDVSDVARRVVVFRQAPEAERLAAIAELTRRRVSFSGTFSATIAALVVASLVGALAAYTSYISLMAQSTATGREDAIALANAFQELGLGESGGLARACGGGHAAPRGYRRVDSADAGDPRVSDGADADVGVVADAPGEHRRSLARRLFDGTGADGGCCAEAQVVGAGRGSR